MPLRRILIGAVLLTGCGDTTGRLALPTAPVRPDAGLAASRALVSAATDGSPRFYLLPPLVPNPHIGPDNDATLLPQLRVEICVLGASGCVAGAPLTTILPAVDTPRKRDDDRRGDDDDFDWDGPWSDARGLRVTGNHYQAVWFTVRGMSASVDYRITVRAGAAALGSVDVDLLADLRSYRQRPGFIPVLAGLPVPVLFRIQHGLVKTLALGSVPATLAPGQSVAVQYTATDYQGRPVAGRTIAWTSSAPSVATIDASGRVTAVAPGTATITATIDGVRASVTIAVAPPSITLPGGERTTIDPTVYLGAGVIPSAVTWTSSAPSLIAVDAAGIVTAVGLGSATVTMRASVAGAVVTRSVQVTATLPAWCSIRPDIAIAPSPFVVLLAGGPGVQLSAPLPAGAPTGTVLAWRSGIDNSVDPSFTLGPDGFLTPRHAGSGTINVVLPGTSTFGTGCVTVLGTPAPPAATPAGVRLRSVPTLHIAPDGTSESAVLTAEVVDAAGNVIAGDFGYRWTVGNQSVLAVSGAAGATATVTALSAGTSSITVAATQATGQLSATATIAVVDQRPPAPGPGTVTIAASQGGILRIGNVVTLTVSGSNGALDAVAWENPDPAFLAVVSTSGTSMTVRVVGGPPAGSTVGFTQVNARVTRSGESGFGSILLTIGS